jgi:hypothetical protein
MKKQAGCNWIREGSVSCVGSSLGENKLECRLYQRLTIKVESYTSKKKKKKRRLHFAMRGGQICLRTQPTEHNLESWIALTRLGHGKVSIYLSVVPCFNDVRFVLNWFDMRTFCLLSLRRIHAYVQGPARKLYAFQISTNIETVRFRCLNMYKVQTGQTTFFSFNCWHPFCGYSLFQHKVNATHRTLNSVVHNATSVHYNEGKAILENRPRRPIGLWNFKAHMFSRRIGLQSGEVVSLTSRPSFIPSHRRFPIRISIRSWSIPRIKYGSKN